MRTYNQHKPILHSYTSYNIKKPLFVLYNKKEAFTKFTKRYTTCEIKIENIIKEKNRNEWQ